MLILRKFEFLSIKIKKCSIAKILYVHKAKNVYKKRVEIEKKTIYNEKKCFKS